MTTEDLLKLNEEIGQDFEKGYLETMWIDPAREDEWFARKARVRGIAEEQLRALADHRGLTHEKAMHFQATDKAYLAEEARFHREILERSRAAQNEAVGQKPSSGSNKMGVFIFALLIALPLAWCIQNGSDDRSEIERGADILCETARGGCY